MSKILPRISWPHVAALAIIVFGVAAVLILAPDTTVGHVLRIVASVMGIAGGAGTAASSGVVRERPAPPASLAPRPMPKRNREEGHAELNSYGLIAVVAILYAAGRSLWHLVHWLGLFAVLVLAGCGASGVATVVPIAKTVSEAGCWAVRRAAAFCDATGIGEPLEGEESAGGEAP